MRHDDARDPRVGTGTRPEPPSPSWRRFEATLRAVVVGLLAVAVIAGATGMLGVAERNSGPVGDHHELTVTYAAVARPGLAAPFSVHITSRNGTGLPAEVTVAVSLDYLGMFDQNGLDPEPASSYADGDEVVWSFDVPAGLDRFSVDLDARIEPGVQWRRIGRVRLVVEGEQVAATTISTWVLP